MFVQGDRFIWHSHCIHEGTSCVLVLANCHIYLVGTSFFYLWSDHSEVDRALALFLSC